MALRHKDLYPEQDGQLFLLLLQADVGVSPALLYVEQLLLKSGFGSCVSRQKQLSPCLHRQDVTALLPQQNLLPQLQINRASAGLTEADVTTKPVISSTGLFVAIAKLWVNILDFSFMPKLIRLLSKDHVPMKIFCKCPTVNISKLCIDKNFIWTTLKAIFSIFRFFCTLGFQIFSCILAKYCPILTNHTSMESLCIQLP